MSGQAGQTSQSGKKEKAKGCFPCGFSCACGCIFFVVLLVIAIVSYFFIIRPFLEKVQEKPSLPQSPPVTREDRWTLNDKIALLGSSTIQLHLSPGEFNALLAKFSPVPAMGFAAVKSFSIFGENKVVFILEGSGFWLHSICIIAEWEGAKSDNQPSVTLSGFQVNSFVFPSRLLKYVKLWYVDGYLKKTIGYTVDELNSSEYKIRFDSKGISIEGNFSEMFKKNVVRK